MDQQMSKGTTMFFLGALTGALALAISTPSNGKETREKIAETVRRVRNKTSEDIGDIEEDLKAARDTTPDRLSKAKEEVEGLAPGK